MANSSDHDGAATRTTVLVVAHVRFYRDGLAAAFRDDSGFAVVASIADIDAAPAAARALRPAVALVDLGPHGGPRSVRELRAAHGTLKVIVLAIEEQEDRVLPLVEAGAVGYVTHEASLAELFATVRCAVRGETLCSPRIVASLARRLTQIADQRPVRPQLGELTVRERQIARLLDEGLSNKEIAIQLCIEVATVKNHVHNILEKLHVHRRGEAAARLRI
jgi:two-component system nitrate/nitrite response regulator NarL